MKRGFFVSVEKFLKIIFGDVTKFLAKNSAKQTKNDSGSRGNALIFKNTYIKTLVSFQNSHTYSECFENFGNFSKKSKTPI